MNKIINNQHYFLYSSIPKEIKSFYYKAIYKFLWKLIFEYPNFGHWYDELFSSDYDIRSGRDIIICENRFSIAGVAIIKNSLIEKKICTLRVKKEFQHQGIGQHLMELCFYELDTEKPMITLHRAKFAQFQTLLEYYNFELEQSKRHYYDFFNTELVYNGFLPERISIFRAVDIRNVYNVIKVYNRKNYTRLINILMQPD